MGFKFNPLDGTGLDIAGTLGGAPPPITQDPNHVASFNSTSDWGSPVSGVYSFAIPAATHGKGLNPSVDVFEDVSGVFELVTVVCKLDGSGNITIQVPDSPDLRFAGKIIISENN